MKIDEATGLPELPKGYFWRVHETHNESNYFRVSLMRKKIWPLGRGVVEEWTADSITEMSEPRVLDMANWVYREWRKLRTSGNETLFGDYPPKKLGAA